MEPTTWPYDWAVELDFWDCAQHGHLTVDQLRTCLGCGEDVTTPDTFPPQCRPLEDA